MLAIGITGFKNSGKITLAGMLATALDGPQGRHRQMHPCGPDLPGRDTSALCAPGRTVAALGEDDIIFGRGKIGFMGLSLCFRRISRWWRAAKTSLFCRTCSACEKC